jgi:hypothetical protein
MSFHATNAENRRREWEGGVTILDALAHTKERRRTQENTLAFLVFHVRGAKVQFTPARGCLGVVNPNE